MHSGGPSFTLRVCMSLACLMWLAGCGAGGGAGVSGKVTLDGSPLDDATISFVPLAEGQRQAAWTTVKEGHYAIASTEGLGTGQFRVEIRALRSVGEKTNQTDPTLPAPAKEAVPSKYNSKSELTADIKPGANTADFELKSK
jgi:hypothetical protein